MKQKTWLEKTTEHLEADYKRREQECIDFMMSGERNELKKKMVDDIFVFGECMTKTTESGIERIEPLSDEWDSVKSKMV